jgi:hypothetical protein
VQTYTFTVNGGPNITIEAALGVSNQTMPNGVIGQAYSHQFNAVNGTAPYTFTVVSGTFPPGLSMNAAGLVSGTPTSAGSFAPPQIQVQSA